MKIKYLLITCVALGVALAGCRKTEIAEPVIDDGTQKKPNELNISPNFKFVSTKTVTVTVDLPFTVDYSLIKAKVDFYYLEGVQKVIVHSGLADSRGHYTGSFKVPSHITDVYAHCLGGDLKLEGAALKSSADGGIYVNFGNTVDTLAPRLLSSAKSGVVQEEESNSSVNVGLDFKSVTETNLITNGDFSTNQFGNISYWHSPIANDGKWYVTSELSGKVSQYNDGGNMVLRINSPSSNYGGVAQIINAGAGDLITLSGNIKVSGYGQKYAWLYLIPRNSSGSALDFFAVNPSYLPSNWGWYQISATMPAGTASCEVLLWMNSWGGTVYFDNIVATGPNPDSDHDGVIDAEDEFPEDATRAFNQYYPSNSTFNTLAFEDNWPSRADYDMNDLVVDVQHRMVLNSSYELVDLYSKIKVKAIGASFHNSFGFVLNTSPQNVASVSGNSITEGIFQFSANNTEAAQENAVIIVTDNAFKQLPYPGSGVGINVNNGTPYVAPTTLEVHVAMSTPVLASTLGNSLLNPFMVINGVRGREVHMIDQAPTSLADMSLFGTSSDNSVPGSGSWYKTENNFPWVIEVPGNFEYPTEKSTITDGYLKFGTWAESAGSLYSDWYLPGISGYRNNALIYSGAN